MFPDTIQHGYVSLPECHILTGNRLLEDEFPFGIVFVQVVCQFRSYQDL